MWPVYLIQQRKGGKQQEAELVKRWLLESQCTGWEDLAGRSWLHLRCIEQYLLNLSATQLLK